MDEVFNPIPFKLVFSEPGRVSPVDKKDDSMSEILQTIYALRHSSSLRMVWHGYSIKLDFSAQIADIYDDITNMLAKLLESHEDHFSIFWGSSAFMAQWSFEQNGGSELSIKSYWTSIIGGPDVLAKLNRLPDVIIISKFEFVGEWIRLIRRIREDAQRAGYNVKHIDCFDATNQMLEKYDYDTQSGECFN